MGPGGGMAPGPALMVAKKGPTPKKKDRNCKEQGLIVPKMFLAQGPAVSKTAVGCPYS